MSESSSKVVRWGIMGAAGIARKNLPHLLRCSNAAVAVVASRSLERARAFAAANRVPAALGSYEELLADGDVDALFVPLPTGVRAEWAVRAARAGKHILCEKPAARNAAEVAHIVRAAREAGVHYMDGVSFMHNPRLERWRALLDDEESFGALTLVTSAFSFPGTSEAFRASNIRVNPDAEPLGCLGDLGWYNVRVSLWAFRWARPARVRARAHARDRGVVTDLSGSMDFGGGRRAEFHCSFDHADRQTVEFLGRRGRLACEDFVHGHLHEHTVELPGRGSARVRDPDYRQPDQVQLMYERFSRMAAGEEGPPAADAAAFWGRVAYTTQCVVDALHRSALDGGAEVEVEYADAELCV